MIQRGQLHDLPELAELFDAYRQFYEQAPDLAVATAFIEQRLRSADSIILIARPNEQALGFCQLYPSWCSVQAGPILVLYDLFISPDGRGLGLGRALLRAAQEQAVLAKVVRMDLTTARTNRNAQALYESEGWQRDEVFLTYQWFPAVQPQL